MEKFYKACHNSRITLTNNVRKDDKDYEKIQTFVLNSLNVCAACGKNNKEGSKACSKCKVRNFKHLQFFLIFLYLQLVSYCNSDCQLKHWKAGHKKECKPTGPAIGIYIF